MTDLTFEERLAALEARLGSLQLGDLPLAALQRKLENDWQPDGSLLLQPNSIARDQLASGTKLAIGKDTLVFAASTDSANLTIKHGLGLVPIVAGGIATAAAVGYGDISAYNTFNFTNASFDINARKPVASTVNVPFYWIAIG